MADVLLVNMPFGPLFAPSLGLSLLKACLSREGIACSVRYFSLDFARRVGQHFYCGVAAEGRPPLTLLAGEWIFSGGLFGDGAGDDEGYAAEILARPTPAQTYGSAKTVSVAMARKIRAARKQAEPFLEACLDEMVRLRPKLVGFTSIFQQHAASLALAKRLRAALPETVIVMGGANCEQVMGAETVRCFPFVDAAVSGEGEAIFPELVRRALAGSSLQGLHGVRTPAGVAAEFVAGCFPGAPPLPRMDDIPYPDFGDFFEQFEATPYARVWEPSLFFESSRGCWWGERQHCTFCGLNGETMAFRSKSAGRALADLERMAGEHPGLDVQVVDNILDMAYFKDFVPALAERKLGVPLFYETKANLRKEQIRLLRKAGITRIQPGIESFSDSVLKLMRKGVTALQNVQLLKWCQEIGVEAHWNVLWGFPGEDPQEYARMARIAPLLTHLRPPTGFCDIRLDRFSPNFWDAERLGFAQVRPLPAYRHVYPALSEEARANLAYFFDYGYREPRQVSQYVAPLVKELQRWAKLAAQSALFSVDVDGRLLIWDLRPAAREPLTVLSGLDRALYRALDAACDLRSLVPSLEAAGFEAAAGRIQDRLGILAERGLVLHDALRYLALAVPLGEYAPAPAIVARFQQVARELGWSAGRGRPLTSLHPSHFRIHDRGELWVADAVRVPLN